MQACEVEMTVLIVVCDEFQAKDAPEIVKLRKRDCRKLVTLEKINSIFQRFSLSLGCVQ